MKKHINGIIFAVAVSAAAAGIYFMVLRTSADFSMKLVYSVAMLLLALIVGIFASAVTRDEKRKSVVKALESISAKGIAIYENGEFVFANTKYRRIEEKTGKNIFRELRANNSLNGYDMTAETSVNGTSEFLILSVAEKAEQPVAAAGSEDTDMTAEQTADNDPPTDSEGGA